eukprot:5601035-Pyramimonas_sp.AAC.1
MAWLGTCSTMRCWASKSRCSAADFIVNSAASVSAMRPTSLMRNLAPSSVVDSRRCARRTSWRQTAQRRLNTPRGLSCAREERLERRGDGAALEVVEGGELERLLVPLQDGGVGLPLDVEARDGHGVA